MGTMKVLLTGATGFLGSHILHRFLKDSQLEIAILRRKTSNGWRIEPLPQQVRQISGDLENIRAIAAELQEFAPETVIHTAWAGVMNCFRNDERQIEQNLLPTLELLKASLLSGCRHFIGLGSQAEYGPLNKKISETDPTEPTTMYGAAKLATSILCQQISRQKGTRFTWLRVFSTYGPMEEPDWMIPYLIRSLLRGQKPSLTHCEQKWDYLFAEDAAEAVWKVVTTGAEGVFNLGSGRVYTLREIVEQIRNQIAPGMSLGFGEVPYRPDQVMHLEADIQRLVEATGWHPKTSLEEGLRADVQWHQQALSEQKT
jgi:UDP-glucose 4-epimerase